MTIGERIKLKREESGLTQDELAQLLGYKYRSSINKIELGLQKKLPFQKVVIAAKALNTTPEYLLGWNRPISEMDETVLKIYPDFVPGKNYLSDLTPLKSEEEIEEPEVNNYDYKVHNIAAHALHDLTEEEAAEVLKFAEFIKAKRNK